MKLKLLQYFYAEDEKRREPHGLQNCELINLRKPSSIKRGFSWATIRGNETVTRYSVATSVQLLLLLQHHHQLSRQLLSGVHLFDLIDLRLKLRAMYMFIGILKTEAIYYNKGGEGGGDDYVALIGWLPFTWGHWSKNVFLDFNLTDNRIWEYTDFTLDNEYWSIWLILFKSSHSKQCR